MPKKARVYELAKELGIPNAKVIEICNDLGIGVKSHSSSVVDAQADRVRRKAISSGIANPTPPEEKAESSSKKAAASTKAVSSKKPPVKKASVKKASIKKVSVKPPVKEAQSGSVKRVVPKPAKPPHSGAVFSSSGRSTATPDKISTPPPRVAQFSRPVSKTQIAKQKTKSVPAAPIKPIKPVKPTKPVVEKAKAPVQKKKPAVKPAPTAKAAPPKPPGPKPPGGMKPPGISSKPIPPPPPRKAPQTDGKSNFRGAGNKFQNNRSSAPRPSGGAGSPRPAAGGFPPRGPGGPGGGPPQGRGGPNSRGGPNRGRSRRKSRKRRSNEDLMPMDLPTYTAEDAPVPKGVVVIERSSTAQDLAERLNRSAADVVRFLLTNGDMVTATQSLSDEMIELFAVDVGAEIRLVNPGEEQEVEMLKLLEFDVDQDLESLSTEPRPPVVTVMGHVDHGKTKLLDRIRSANVVDGEAGGITQHIGAYQIDHNGKKITFLDTPGHEAFTAMRARGAGATDIVILVVAADDGVMPQTLEALDHARAAEVPIIVAINKIDREGSDPQRVIAQLGERNLIPEAWGGDTIMCEVSAMTGDGIDALMDSLLLVAEVEDLKATHEGVASGVVLESHLDIGRGSVATVIVQQGVLNVGDPMVTGASWGRVRALVNDRGEAVQSADPATPVQVLGLSEVAQAGDRFIIAPSEKIASKVGDTRGHWLRVASLGRDAAASSSGAKLEDIFNRIQAGEVATLNLIVKADVNGSLEAVCDSLKKLERDEVKLSFMLRGVGGITENDVQLAAASNATILGFNVRPDRKARELAAKEVVEIRNYEIIYKLIEDIQAAMLGMLAPEFEEVVTGDAEVREIFRVPKIGAIAGVMVSNGVITRGSKVRFLRDGVIIWKGDIESLKRFKEDAKEVAAGFECGIGLSDFQDLKEGDIIETYMVKEIERSFDD